MDIDQEWENFISSNGDGDGDDSDDSEYENTQLNNLLAINTINHTSNDVNAPKATDIYISTKTKIAYLNTAIDLKDIFWEVPTISYYNAKEGVIKKQMKFNSLDKSDVDYIKTKLVGEPYFEEHIITHIDNPNGRIKFKDVRKVSIGISKKDLLSYRCKKKSAFYNCFVLILRMKQADVFKEYHVKVFNTGKLEIPGVQNDESFQMILQKVITILQPHIKTTLAYKENSTETVLINSNFNCGFFINRESLYEILKLKYNIQAIYDPCSYPGIQCKFYYNPDVGIQSGSQISEANKAKYNDVKMVSFMIFRTGSVLIVGKCDENVLYIIYEFLKVIFHDEYKNISQKNTSGENQIFTATKEKSKKARRRNIIVEFN